MKKALVALLLTSSASFFPSAYAGPHDAHDHADHGAATASEPTDSDLVDGTVKKIDKTNGKVTVMHAPLKNLNMPAMTMAFSVKDASWLDQMQIGDKIRFVANQIDGNLVIIRFEAAK